MIWEERLNQSGNVTGELSKSVENSPLDSMFVGGAPGVKKNRRWRAGQGKDPKKSHCFHSRFGKNQGSSNTRESETASDEKGKRGKNRANQKLKFVFGWTRPHEYEKETLGEDNKQKKTGLLVSPFRN